MTQSPDLRGVILDIDSPKYPNDQGLAKETKHITSKIKADIRHGIKHRSN